MGRGTGVPVRPTRDEQSLLYPETVVPCGLDSQQLDKALLFRSRCPRKRGPLFCALSGLRHSAKSGPARQWLPLWGSWREAPERARMLTTKRGRSDGIALTKSLLIAVWRLLAKNRALLDKKRTDGFLDSRPAMRYNIHRKGTVTNGLASF